MPLFIPYIHFSGYLVSTIIILLYYDRVYYECCISIINNQFIADTETPTKDNLNRVIH